MRLRFAHTQNKFKGNVWVKALAQAVYWKGDFAGKSRCPEETNLGRWSRWIIANWGVYTSTLPLVWDAVKLYGGAVNKYRV